MMDLKNVQIGFKMSQKSSRQAGRQARRKAERRKKTDDIKRAKTMKNEETKPGIKVIRKKIDKLDRDQAVWEEGSGG